MRKKLRPKRILAIRTDRIGDVLLTTPALRALRKAFPSVYLALLVRPYTRELVENNPDLDEVMVYDKRKGWFYTWRFITALRKKRFDLALVFNPRFRNNLIAFLAGIPTRVSYDNKGGWLATLRIKNLKHLDEKHELDYTLDFVRILGVELTDVPRHPVLAVKREVEDYIDNFLKDKYIEQRKLIVVHPGATAPSKRWPQERFAKVADELIKAGWQVIIVGSREEKESSRKMLGLMNCSAQDLTGIFDLRQLAALIKKGRLLISNDAGPVHIAAALGTPVVVIFGRKAGGLGPASWAPLGRNCCVLQKDIGCEVCLHDRCPRNFACLQALTVDEVVKSAKNLLNKKGDRLLFKKGN